MFGGNAKFSQVITLDYDPTADDYIPLWRAPQDVEITAAYATIANDLSANTANYFDLTLVNGGTGGTAQNAITTATGGTGGWTGLVPKTFSIGSGSANITSGQLVTLLYNEEGTGTFTQLTVQLDYVIGT